MNEKIEQLRDRTPGLVGNQRVFEASVVIPLIKTENGFNILFEVRSSTLPDQPGDICLPGGAIEAGETAEQAATRELCEELLVNPEQLEIIALSDVVHNDNMTVYPYIGYLTDYKGTFDDFESECVFQVPLEFFRKTEPEVYEVQFQPMMPENFPFDRIVGGRNYKWRSHKVEELFYEYEGRTIWGLTAKILRAFVKLLG